MAVDTVAMLGILEVVQVPVLSTEEINLLAGALAGKVDQYFSLQAIGTMLAGLVT